MTEEKVLEILKAISHPSRVEILAAVRAKQDASGATCNSVLNCLNISQSTFSHHISELIQTGLVVGKSQGKFMMLSIDENVWEEFHQKLGQAIFKK